MSQNQCHRIKLTTPATTCRAFLEVYLRPKVPRITVTCSKFPFTLPYTYWYFRDRTIYRHYIVFMCLLNQLLKPLLRHCPRVTTSDKHTSLFLYTFVLSHAVSSEKLMGNSHICSCGSINLFRHHNYTTSSET